MQRWVDRHNRESWGSGVRLGLVADSDNGWRAPWGLLVWEAPPRDMAVRLISARGTVHIPLVYNVTHIPGRMLAPRVLLQAVGGIQPPSLVGDVLRLLPGQTDAERLATIGRLGGDHARLAYLKDLYLKDLYRRELRGNDPA